MRAWAVPVALLLAAGALAGCVNTPKDPTVGGATTGTRNPPATNGGITTAPPLLRPLALTVDSPDHNWVAPGSSINVTATTAATGWTYAWSIGPLPGTVMPSTFKPDTGSAKDASDWISPGAQDSITFTEAGVFQMHCDPHPFMRSNVTVVDGYEGPKEVHVQILDGSELGSYRFSPENILIGKNTRVIYTNNGTQAHTATMSSSEPPLKALPLKASAGAVTVEGSGWQRIRLVAVDATGRLGAADLPVYVAPLPSLDPAPWEVSFQAGGLPEQAVAPASKAFVIDHNATLTVSWTFQDAVAQNGGPVNNAEVDIHVFPQGETQDVITSETVPEGEATQRVLAGTYTVKVVPKKGLDLKGTVTVTGVFEDPAPPAPVMAGAGAVDDAHAGH